MLLQSRLLAVGQACKTRRTKMGKKLNTWRRAAATESGVMMMRMRMRRMAVDFHDDDNDGTGNEGGDDADDLDDDLSWWS